jgi:hypothetical protein
MAIQGERRHLAEAWLGARQQAMGPSKYGARGPPIPDSAADHWRRAVGAMAARKRHAKGVPALSCFG